MQVPLLDLKAQYKTIKEEVETSVKDVLKSQYFILGPKVVELENDIAAEKALSLPIYPELDSEQKGYIIEQVVQFYK